MPDISLTPHLLVREIGKPAAEFTKSDLVELVERRGIRMLNFRYVAGDGRLKKLNFTINSREHLDRVLTLGERVDGSSLFPFVAASASDLYVVPRYRTAFLNPFAEEPTLDLMCSFYDVDGNPLASAPEQVLRRAQAYLEETTGARLEALGELEYYLFSEVDSIYPIVEQRGYHEAHPYSKWGSVRRETMMRLAEMGAQIKYGHAEVGNIVSDNQEMVQHEIEFLPVPIEEAADQMVLAKWVLREVAYRHGLQVSYAPKIIVGQAGSGMHFHTRLSRDGRYTFSDGQGLTEDARKVIAGYLQRAASLTAWGNTVPTSYLRLVPHQEAPTSICWGDRNRSVLVRVPLGWRGVGDRMVHDANPLEPRQEVDATAAQTVEVRSPDGSAQVHLLLAGLAVAARTGLVGQDSLEIAERLYVAEDASGRDDLAQLPASCTASAEALLADRAVYEEGGVFPPGLIDAQARMLRGYGDDQLSERLFGNAEALSALVAEHLHVG
ncbi:glutamine synthetase family protein [Arsenicicoccus dermatophilus]|uniref:glutamine synthetase family protein n=1 Tax=Arsenicicoccus dermatophilus TaxID=1076331 RepID=UPI001F4C722D|nr:glutamine synthetase family protein [Arsenicicoccus dermatophilus]MCH8613271.1 glutamine synthetase family protein [Arsenicicoccus dermatophilus]